MEHQSVSDGMKTDENCRFEKLLVPETQRIIDPA